MVWCKYYFKKLNDYNVRSIIDVTMILNVRWSVRKSVAFFAFAPSQMPPPARKHRSSPSPRYAPPTREYQNIKITYQDDFAGAHVASVGSSKHNNNRTDWLTSTAAWRCCVGRFLETTADRCRRRPRDILAGRTIFRCSFIFFCLPIFGRYRRDVRRGSSSRPRTFKVRKPVF